MQTLKIMFTRGDYATQPGGLIFRYDEERRQYSTHRFNRRAHTRDPVEFYWGHYFLEDNGPNAKQKAEADFEKRRADCLQYEISEGELIANGDVGYDISGKWMETHNA